MLCGNKYGEQGLHSHTNSTEARLCHEAAGLIPASAAPTAAQAKPIWTASIAAASTREATVSVITPQIPVTNEFGQTMASENFLRLLKDIIAERAIPARLDNWLTYFQSQIADRKVTKVGGSNAMKLLKTLPYKSSVASEDGIYRNPKTGEIFKLQFNKAVGNGLRLSAKRLHIVQKWERDAEGNVLVQGKGKFVYEPGLSSKVLTAWKMDDAEAAEFGKLYGFCVKCGTTLTDEVSIAEGLGPVCGGRRER